MKHPVDIQHIITIVQNANQIALDIYDAYVQDSAHTLQIDYKSDQSPVTHADIEVSTYICSELTRLYPDIPIICEETKQIPYNERKHFNYFWLVDPIDGTKEFITKNGEFTVNIALIHNNISILGVVGVPCQNKIYYAGFQEEGSYLINNNLTTRIHCKPINRDHPIIVCSRSHARQDDIDYMNQFESYEKISRGSSLKFMMVAEGVADIYPRMCGSMEWDTAASHVIVEQSGATIRTHPNQSILSYNKESLLNPYFIVIGSK
jgi:3'(2'), 5'-bisphosphate nucleotidase